MYPRDVSLDLRRVYQHPSTDGVEGVCTMRANGIATSRAGIVLRRDVYAASLSRVRRKSRNGSHFAYTDGHGSREPRKVPRLTRLNRRLCAAFARFEGELAPVSKEHCLVPSREEANT